jgi:transcription antitermination factor NusG
MKQKDRNSTAWYVMRVTYQRELATAELLNEMGIENYIPTVRIKIRNEKGVSIGWKTEPLVHNYIFIRESYNRIYELKQGKLEHLRFLMEKDPITGQSNAQCVPDKQMADFIKIVRTSGMKPVPVDIDLRKGDRVRVVMGPFEGVEGTFIRMPNRHEKRVVIKIEGVAAVATVELKSSEVEKLEVNKETKQKKYNI